MKKLSAQIEQQLLDILKNRFEKNMFRHPDIRWSELKEQLQHLPEKLWSLNEMERTGGEPDLVVLNSAQNLTFYDCCTESPKGRRSHCYDLEALKSRKANLPEHHVVGRAVEMGVNLLTEDIYHDLQRVFPFDLKSSSWVCTPEDIRRQGGAIFCDLRYGRVFTYHNGAESYYSSRGFRAYLNL
ncbi:DUF4256 domain-containing protein [Acinetobacter chinensis]|jgi:hypothetical protein|uniref:DUF4256 domain-containing protein n=1 Tax=Acinetobacter chinensis TaxID=2004650 RepID=UPI00293489EE|nr:DUF4256 domain-containing protein [Acinetobacter chinensis]WOE41632.1 DUF4256 domain-containing protein [Acinetobacter chinensis]